MPVDDLEVVAVAVEQPLPGAGLRDYRLRLERPGGAFVGHLEEEQIGELLGVLDGADAVVAQDIAERPQLVDLPPSQASTSSGLSPRSRPKGRS